MRQIDALESPRFTQITTFGRLPECKGQGERAFFLGIPFDDATSFRPGARFGPSAIRQASRMLRPYNRFQDTCPFDLLNMCDYGDVNVVPGSVEDTMARVQEWFRANLKEGQLPLIAGGDHSVTLPVLMSLPKGVSLIHFDSHFDTWDSYWGRKYTHGTWLRRAIEMGVVNQVYQVGIRSPLYSKEDVKEVERLGVKVFYVEDVKENMDEVIHTLNSIKGKVYISLDIDVVDPAFAPGTGTPEVGGLTSYEVLKMMRSLKVDLVGMDVVEVSPPYDVSEITSLLASYLLYEGASVKSKVMERG